jgi:HEAT repeat protein
MSLIFSGMFFWRDYSRRTRMQAVKHAADSPHETMDVATLAWALESNSEPLKRDAARVVARMGNDANDALPALIEALSIEDSSFSHRTHTSIVRAIGSVGPDAKSAVPHLMKLLGQTDSTGSTDSRNRATIQALGQIGPAAAVAIPMLLDHLNRQNASNRDVTLQALAKIGPNSKDVVAALIKKLESDSFLAGEVVDALEMMGPEATEAVRVYTEGIFDHVANGGGFFGLTEAGGATIFVPIEAQRKLRNLGGLATPLLRAGLNDEREPVRVISAHVLVDRGEDSSEVAKVLLAALDKPCYQGGAIGALTKLGPSAQTALPALRSLSVNVADDSPRATMLSKAIRAIEEDPRETPAPKEPKEVR